MKLATDEYEQKRLSDPSCVMRHHPFTLLPGALQVEGISCFLGSAARVVGRIHYRDYSPHSFSADCVCYRLSRFYEFVPFLAVGFSNYADTLSTVPFLELADYLVEASFDLLQVIIDKLAPLLFEIAFELHPFPIEPIRIHGFLIREMALRSVCIDQGSGPAFLFS